MRWWEIQITVSCDPWCTGFRILSETFIFRLAAVHCARTETGAFCFNYTEPRAFFFKSQEKRLTQSTITVGPNFPVSSPLVGCEKKLHSTRLPSFQLTVAGVTFMKLSRGQKLNGKSNRPFVFIIWGGFAGIFRVTCSVMWFAFGCEKFAYLMPLYSVSGQVVRFVNKLMSLRLFSLIWDLLRPLSLSRTNSLRSFRLQSTRPCYRLHFPETSMRRGKLPATALCILQCRVRSQIISTLCPGGWGNRVFLGFWIPE